MLTTGINRAGPNRAISRPATRITGSEVTAEIARKIGSVLMSNRASRIASRAALPATNAAITITALIVAIHAAPRWSSLGGTAWRLLAGGRAGRGGHEPIVQPPRARREQQPAHGEHDVQDGERTDAEAEHLDEQEHDAEPGDHVAHAEEEGVDGGLRLVLAVAAGRQEQRLPQRVVQRVVEAVLRRLLDPHHGDVDEQAERQPAAEHDQR